MEHEWNEAIMEELRRIVLLCTPGAEKDTIAEGTELGQVNLIRIKY